MRTRMLRSRSVAQWLLALATVAYVTYLVTGLGRGDSRLDRLVTDWLQIALLAAAAAIAVTGARRAREDRRAWWCMALAICSWTLGQLVWVLAYRDVAEPPFPSLSDLLWTLPYPLYYVALVLLVRRRVRRFHKSWWLDGVIAVLAVSAIAAAMIFKPLREITGGSADVVAVTLAYPVADLVLLAMIAGVFAVTGWRPGRTWVVLGAGLALNSAADVIYAWQSSAGTFTEGTAVEAVWVVAALTVAAAPWQPAAVATRLRLQGWRAIAAPLGFGTLMLALLASDFVHEISPLADGLAIAALAAVLLRTALTFRENLLLADSRRLAATDELTGLANRRGFYARADAALARSYALGLPSALMLLDLDRFKELNDTLGHQAGDELLAHFAERLKLAVPEAEVLGRLGGDEFVLLLRAGANASDALEAADHLAATLEEPVALNGLLTHVSASIGIAISPEHGHGRSDLLRRADVAMYRAKARRSGVELYDPADDPHSLERLALVSELRRAFGQGQLVLHHQPKLDLASGEVTGVEALVRWQHPERGLLYPDVFIPLAERYGLARPLTLEVLDLALAARDSWARAGFDLQVAVNLTAADVLDARLPGDVSRRLDEWSVPPGALQLEITENTIMLDPGRTLDVLAQLSELGVGLSLDDFGTGYSSLAYLNVLPVQELKIDRSFVMAMTESPDDDVIVRSTALLGRNLGLGVVAEGVETAEHLERVKSYGCDVAQGYYLSRPVPSDELMRWLERERSGGDRLQRVGTEGGVDRVLE
jgi:diguanylate cyclase (GGDEF)-like protein